MCPGALSSLILTGFMGSGKTAVGRAVAARLGRPFVDMDTLIKERTGRAIADIFAQEEEAHFRQLEAALCRELAAEQGLVIATGGWALGPADNRATMARTGLIVCLTATGPELIRRLAGQTERPLLMGDDWQLHLERLLTSRQATYRQIPLQVDTTRLSPDEVADRVLRLWGAFRETGPPHVVPVTAPGGGYQVLIGHGLLDRLGALMAALGPPLGPPRGTGGKQVHYSPQVEGKQAHYSPQAEGKQAHHSPQVGGKQAHYSPPQAGGTEGGPIVVVSDENVGPLYGSRVIEAVGQAGNSTYIPAGEEHKTLDTLRRLYDQLLNAGLDRSGTVVALGGGVVGDVAGFAAATFMRGVRLVQVPTTLLAMVDSSVGGKTGVDLPQGKNLVGAFKQPALVVADPDTLRTLPAVELQAGLAEVVKHGIIGDKGLFAELENSGFGIRHSSPPPWGAAERDSSLTHLIARAVKVKQNVVEADPFEEGRRAVLNLGHTFGHALEKCSGYQLKHGQAVAVGLVAAARVGAGLGICEDELPTRVTALLQKLGLPTNYREMTPEALWAAMATDKKRHGQRLRFVLPEAIGRVIVTDQVPKKLVLEVLAGLREGE
jgi:shikimate kinase/3-dehydroquinate synthase